MNNHKFPHIIIVLFSLDVEVIILIDKQPDIREIYTNRKTHWKTKNDWAATEGNMNIRHNNVKKSIKKRCRKERQFYRLQPKRDHGSGGGLGAFAEKTEVPQTQ